MKLLDQFVIMPRESVYDNYNLNNDSKILYLYLFDMIRKSNRNTNGNDEDLMSLDLKFIDLQNAINGGYRKAEIALKNLIECDLIHIKKINNRMIRVYLKNVL